MKDKHDKYGVIFDTQLWHGKLSNVKNLSTSRRRVTKRQLCHAVRNERCERLSPRLNLVVYAWERSCQVFDTCGAPWGIKVGSWIVGRRNTPRWEIKVRFPSSGEPQRRGVTHRSSHARWRERAVARCVDAGDARCASRKLYYAVCMQICLSPAAKRNCPRRICSLTGGRRGGGGGRRRRRRVTHTRALNARDRRNRSRRNSVPFFRVACAKLRAWLFFPRLPSLPTAAIYEFILFSPPFCFALSSLLEITTYYKRFSLASTFRRYRGTFLTISALFATLLWLAAILKSSPDVT